MAKASKVILLEAQSKLTEKVFQTIENYSVDIKKIENLALKKIKKAVSISAVDIILNECKSDVQKLTSAHRKNLKDLNEAITKNMKRIDDISS